MPLYDYKCPACGTEKEVRHAISEIGKIEILCDNCQSVMKKQLSMPSLIGFDDVGRSMGNKEKDQTEKPSPEKKTAETGSKEPSN